MKKILKVLLKFLYIFPINSQKLFLLCFDGTKIGYDSKAFAEWINKNYYNRYHVYWGVKDKKRINNKLEGVRFVNLKSFGGLFHLLTAKVIFYNINPPTYVPYRKNQVLVNSWHGYAFKKCGKYITNNFDSNVYNTSDAFLSHAKDYSEFLIRDSFEFQGEILDIGTPRNDIMFDKERMENICKKVKDFYSIDYSTKILIYAPTFRNDFEIADSNINYEKLCEVLSNKFKGHWKIFLRLHPMISNKLKLDNEKIIDVSSYSDMQELLCCADLLITDYSSCIWDFSLSQKAAFIYADDYEKYKKNRGLYKSFETSPFPVSKNNKELIETIDGFDIQKYKKNLREYFEKIKCYEKGYACEELYRYLKKRGLK